MPWRCATGAATSPIRRFADLVMQRQLAAHLAGVTAALTTLPVLGVPLDSSALDGMDALLSTVQMPSGIPVGTLAIGEEGAVNAALLAGQILGLKYPEIREAVKKDREERRQAVLADSDPRA